MITLSNGHHYINECFDEDDEELTNLDLIPKTTIVEFLDELMHHHTYPWMWHESPGCWSKNGRRAEVLELSCKAKVTNKHLTAYELVTDEVYTIWNYNTGEKVSIEKFANREAYMKSVTLPE